MTVDDPLEAELLVSDMLGTWWNLFLVDADPEVVFGEGLVAYAGRSRSPAAIALLCGIRALGTDQQRRRAAAALARPARAGGSEPAWAGRIGAPQPTESWIYQDVYGDQTSVFLDYRGAGVPHGLIVLVDHTLGGFAKDAIVTDDPDAVLAGIRREIDSPLATLRKITSGDARAILEPALAATDAAVDPPIDEDYRATRAFTHARVRALPEPAEPQLPVADIPPADRAAIVKEFLASPQAKLLADRGAARRCVELIVDFGCDLDGGQPFRVSPAKTDIFLLGWLPSAVELAAAEQAMMPAAVSAWVRFAGQRAGLPTEALKELRQAAGELGAQFAAAYEAVDQSGNEPDDPVAPDRRRFVAPRRHTRIGGEEYPDLDPSDPDERSMLIAGEHPGYHDVLDDPYSDETTDGVNPRLHLAVHEIVANQLWDDDPPEAWQAVERLRGQQLDRHDILHALGEVLLRHLHGALTQQTPIDLVGYRRDLAALGMAPVAPARRRPDTRTRGPAGEAPGLFEAPARVSPAPPAGRAGRLEARGSAYQLKVTLDGTKPPVWRRVRVPGSLSLGELHSVIQVAMGWEDDHLHAFTVGGRRFGPGGTDLQVEDEEKITIGEALPRMRARMLYDYDIGDSWQHEVVVEEIERTASAVEIACLAGRRACPPEDCGGIWGYAELCDAMSNPGHERHDELLDWLGYRFDPAAFDRGRVNARLGRLAIKT